MNDEEKLPKWARERLEIERDMGPPETNASIGTVIGGLLYFAIRIGLFVLFCVLIYMIGRAVVG